MPRKKKDAAKADPPSVEEHIDINVTDSEADLVNPPANPPARMSITFLTISPFLTMSATGSKSGAAVHPALSIQSVDSATSQSGRGQTALDILHYFTKKGPKNSKRYCKTCQ
jgi:hypothetical protein